MTSREDAAMNRLNFIVHSTARLRVHNANADNAKSFDCSMHLAPQEFSRHSIPRILRALHSRRPKFARICAMASRAFVLNAHKSVGKPSIGSKCKR